MEFGEKFYNELNKLEKEFASMDSESKSQKQIAENNKTVAEVPASKTTISTENYLDPKTNKKTYHELKNKINLNGVAPHLKEEYLTSEEFLKVFGKTEKEFSEFPQWKKVREKKRLGLF